VSIQIKTYLGYADKRLDVRHPEPGGQSQHHRTISTAQQEDGPAIVDESSDITEIDRSHIYVESSRHEENEPSEISKLIYILKLQLANEGPQPITQPLESQLQETYDLNYVSVRDLVGSGTSEDVTMDTGDPSRWVSHYSQHGVMNRQSSAPNPLKIAAWGSNLDAFLPSGVVYIYSSPYNEVYPFPSSVEVLSGSPNTRIPTMVNEEAYKASLNTLETMYPENDIRWYHIMRGNAAAMMRTGKYKEAEILFRKMIVSSSNIFGPNSTETVDTMCNVAGAMYNQGGYAQASQYHNQTHEKAARIFPSDHPIFLKSFSTKARIAGSLGEDQNAEEEIQRQVVQISLCKFGPKDNFARQCLQFLAMCLMNAKKYKLCEELLYIVIEIGQSILDQQTDMVKAFYARTLQMLCRTLWEQGKYDECERMSQMARAKARSLLHMYHENVMALDYRLATAWRKQGRLRESEELLRDVLDRQLHSIGEGDQDTLYTTFELAELLGETKRYEEASVFRQKFFRGRIKTFGAVNRFSFEGFEKLLKTYEAEGRRADTDDLAMKYLEQLKELKGDDDPQLARFRKLVTEMSKRLELKAEARPEGLINDGNSILEDFLEEEAWKDD